MIVGRAGDLKIESFTIEAYDLAMMTGDPSQTEMNVHHLRWYPGQIS